MKGEILDATGGCMCGAVRYRVSGETVLVEFCHCEDCRRATGAPVMAWAAFRHRAFDWIKGEPTKFNSSPSVTRTFSGCCGTSLTISDERYADDIYVAPATFDESHTLAPEIHIWRSERLPWLETADRLPRYVRFEYEGILEELATDH